MDLASPFTLKYRADGIEADDLRNRFTNVGKCRPQALRCQLLFTAGPKELGQFGA